ncbi:MAG: helix-turn-helix transcriptional regulator [Archangium sp.]|nr:helix-turn-helix transcriptional regulator [Archangium sp.]
MPLRRATTIPDFLAAPAGRYVAGSSWVVFHVNQSVAGLAMWGTPTPADLAPLLDIFKAFDSPLGKKLPRYFDARRLVAAEGPVIAQLLEFVQLHHVRLEQLFTAIAFVHHGGVGQAITEGIRLLSHLPFAWADFRDSASALQWLQCPRASEVADELEGLIASGAGDSMLVHDVRAFCASAPGTPRLESAARALRMSTRSLQRRLTEQGTSFQHVLQDVRVERAMQLLRTTTLTVSEVAHAVGCAPRHLAAMFRKATKLSPSAWRAQQGRTPAPDQQGDA